MNYIAANSTKTTTWRFERNVSLQLGARDGMVWEMVMNIDEVPSKTRIWSTLEIEPAKHGVFFTPAKQLGMFRNVGFSR